MDARREAYTMLSEMFSGMRRYKRVARFVDRKKMKQTVKATRIGRQSISFTGDFPEAGDWTPVETFGCRRSYMQPAREQGLERVIGTEDVGRLSIFSEHGVRLGAAVAMLVVMAAVLGGAWVMAHADNAGVAKRLAQQETRMQTLETQTTTLRSEIASRSSGVNVRQEAVRIGLRNSRGTQSAYVDVPDAATIDPANFGLQRDTASVFGQ